MHRRNRSYLYWLLICLTLFSASPCKALSRHFRQSFTLKGGGGNLTDLASEFWSETFARQLDGQPHVFFLANVQPENIPQDPGAEQYSFRITIDKKWYKQGWTLFFIGLSFLFSFWSLSELRTYHRRKQNRRDALSIERVRNLKQALRVLNNSKKDADQKLRLQTHLLASIAHDIRTPLGFISSAAADAKRQLESSQNERVIKTNEMIAYTSGEMVQLVENLITFMKTSIYGGEIQVKKINLRRLVMDKTSIFNQVVGPGYRRLAIDISPDIFVTTNASLLGVIIHNLVDNALKIKSGNQISIFCLEQQGIFHLVIGDQGPGMPASLMDWLSGALNEDNGAGQTDSSSGLGLIIVREISKMLGIKIRVENLPGA